MDRVKLSKQKGFSLLEMSLVLIVIAVIVGAASVASDLQRSATYQRMGSSFINGWQSSYTAHASATGVVPGDSQIAPTGKINGSNNSQICNLNLRNAMFAAGVSMPSGRGEGYETRFGYQDANGNPQDAEVCFENVDWSGAGGSADSYVVERRNVMVIKSITPDVARMLDSMIDGNADARFGALRLSSEAAKTTTASQEWSIGNLASGGDEDQITRVTAYYVMSQ